MDRKTFAGRIKAKYPAYASLDDEVLVDKVLAKHPQYKSSLDAPSAPGQEAAAGAQTGVAGQGGGPGAGVPAPRAPYTKDPRHFSQADPERVGPNLRGIAESPLIPAGFGLAAMPLTAGLSALPAMGLAGLSMAGGESWRQLAAKATGGESPETSTEAAGEIAKAGAWGVGGEGVTRAIPPLWGAGKKGAQGTLEWLTDKFSNLRKGSWETLKQAPEEVAEYARRGWTRTPENVEIPLALEHANKLEAARKAGGAEALRGAKETVAGLKQQATEQASLAREAARIKGGEVLRTGREQAREVEQLHAARAKTAGQEAKVKAEQAAIQAQERVKEAAEVTGENYRQMLRDLSKASETVRLPIDDTVTPAWETYLKEVGGSAYRNPLTPADAKAVSRIKKIYGEIALSSEFGMSPSKLATHLQDLTEIQKNFATRASSGLARSLKEILIDAIPPKYGFIKTGRESYRAAKELERGISKFSKSDTPATVFQRVMAGGGKTAEALRRAIVKVPGFAEDISALKSATAAGEASGAALKATGKRASQRILELARTTNLVTKKLGQQAAQSAKGAVKAPAERAMTAARESAEALEQAYQPDINIARAGAAFAPWAGASPKTGITGMALAALAKVLAGNAAGIPLAAGGIVGASPRLAMNLHLAGKAAAPVIEKGAAGTAKGIPALLAAILEKLRKQKETPLP